MPDEMEMGINAARNGQKAEALQYFKIVLRDEPENAVAWLWTAGVVNDPNKKRKCLERVLELEPGNPSALRALADIGTATAAATKHTISPDTHPAPFTIIERSHKINQSRSTIFKSGGTLPLQVSGVQKEGEREKFTRTVLILLALMGVAVSVGTLIWLAINFLN
jgi:hypothetical protein